jgi:ABC-type antimicrobial peptide transport system permease subunit
MVVNLNPGADPIRAQQDLQTRLNSMGNYEVYFEDALLRKFGAAFQDLRSMSVLLTAIAITAVTLSSHNQAWLATDERKFNLGILRTVGFDRAAVEGYLLTRALLINFAAFLLAYIAARTFIKGTTLEIFSFGGTRLSLELTPSMILLGLLLSSASTLLGTWLSSRKTTSSTPADLLGRGKGASFT